MTASIPVSERLLNEVVAAAIPPSVPVRDVAVHPKNGNRLVLRAKPARLDFLPSLNVTVAIEQQPALPDSPLVLRLLTFPGLIALIGAAFPFASRLPRGVRMERDRVYVDLKSLLEHQGYGDLVPLITSLRITTDEGNLTVDVELQV